MFIFLCVITHIIYTKFTGYGMFGGDGHYNLIDGIYPFFKISIGFFIILYFTKLQDYLLKIFKNINEPKMNI